MSSPNQDKTSNPRVSKLLILLTIQTMDSRQFDIDASGSVFNNVGGNQIFNISIGKYILVYSIVYG